MTMGAELGGVLTVKGVPAKRFVESQDHQHELIRELRLVEIGERFDLTSRNVSQRLGSLIAEILEGWGDVRSTTRNQAIAAIERGEDEVDLTIPVRPGLADALQRWLRLLDEADRFCEGGELLTMAASPEIRELRAWYVAEILSQLSDPATG